MDIIETSEGSQTGYLADDAYDYAKCIANILYNSYEENETIRKAARFVSATPFVKKLKSDHNLN